MNQQQQQQLYQLQQLNDVGVDNMYFNDNHLQQHYLQQMELERICQVQQQAAVQQQRALLHQQQMMYYEQQQQIEQQFSMDYSNLQQEESSPPPNTGGKAQKRAEHNAIERARRESLNTKFQQLAHSLPNLQNDRRPSKGTIIERTLEYVKQTVQKEERFQTEIEKLRQANESLISKMTDNVIDEQDEYDYEEETCTPECEDNLSSRSSITSTSSQHQLYFNSHSNVVFNTTNKFQQDSSSFLLSSSREPYLQF